MPCYRSALAFAALTLLGLFGSVSVSLLSMHCASCPPSSFGEQFLRGSLAFSDSAVAQTVACAESALDQFLRTYEPPAGAEKLWAVLPKVDLDAVQFFATALRLQFNRHCSDAEWLYANVRQGGIMSTLHGLARDLRSAVAHDLLLTNHYDQSFHWVQPHGWSHYLLPFSSCKVWNMSLAKAHVATHPQESENCWVWQKYSERTLFWFTSQSLAVVFQPSARVRALVEAEKRRLGLHDRAYVALHVRGTDKAELSGTYALDEFVDAVRRFLDVRRGDATSTSPVFVATDSDSTLHALREGFPQVRWVWTDAPRETGNTSIRATYFKNFDGLLREMLLLAESAYFVGTYSSNIGRFVAERKRAYADSDKQVQETVHFLDKPWMQIQTNIWGADRAVDLRPAEGDYRWKKTSADGGSLICNGPIVAKLPVKLPSAPPQSQ